MGAGSGSQQTQFTEVEETLAKVSLKLTALAAEASDPLARSLLTALAETCFDVVGDLKQLEAQDFIQGLPGGRDERNGSV